MNETFVLRNNVYMSVEPFKQMNDRLLVGFTTRKDGYSMEPYSSLNLGLHVHDNDEEVIANREKLANELQIALANWVFSEQVHGSNIKKVSKKDCGAGTHELTNAILDTDGLYTNDKNVLLASLYADCVPLYFYSPTYNIVGLAHAGWKGTVGGIGPKMVQRWTEDEQIPLEAIYVAIGPSISKEKYEVDDFVISKVKDVVTNHHHLLYEEVKPNKYLLDLKELNKQLLIRVGIKEEHIFVSNYCTYKESDLFFSYRREQQTGRMMSFIGRT
uniref:Purine nucleoside phosphorylase n=1 Tax=Anaerobacillus isosaccharinicus TaxID=1532552 RepID=A0A1S2M9Z0_9BACI